MNRRLGWTLALLATITYSTNTIGRGAILAGLDLMMLLTATSSPHRHSSAPPSA
ncbi:MAG: hypothetical protein R2838_01730 [Caldilineaceae bacterium]